MADSIKTLIENYKKYIQENTLAEESYKWKLVNQFKGRPDLDAPDFYEEIKSIQYGNLIFHNGIGVVYHLAKDRPEQYRNCFKVLFNEELPLEERLKSFNTETLKIYRELQPNEKHSHHQDERTMATLLAFHNPDKYPFYKDSFYQKYCKLLEIKPKPTGEKYLHYLEMVNNLIQEYIEPDVELIVLVNNLLPEDGYPDTQHKILAQDILYRMLDKGIEEAEKEFRNHLKKFSIPDLTFYFQTLDKLIEELDISDTPHLVFSTKSGQLSFHVGRRYCLVLQNKLYYFIAPENYEVPGVESSYFTGGKNPAWIKEATASMVLEHYPALKEAVSNELQYNNSAKPKENDNPVFRKVVFDKAYRANFFDTTSEEMTSAPEEKEANVPQNQPLNQILFGPPGTGKTYHTINRALEICGVETVSKTREELKNEFDRRLATGQIVFTTFHQSMSYEDFIEGIKPKTTDSKVIYEVEDGILKLLGNKARPSCGNFEEVIEAFKSEISEADGNTPITIQSKATTFDITYRGTNVFNVQPHSTTKDKPWYTVNISLIRKAYETNSYVGVYKSTYVREIIVFLQQNRGLSKSKDDQQKPFVLIIDEINRGNVSQIFGELITLIEEDKRLGSKEALEVTLPYSKEQFGVPSNLYIIGTMNTADRSVEALDTALRRRFSFVEMPPRYDLEPLQNEIIEGFTLSNILAKINLRIEKLLGKDNLIGHSYFLDVKDVDRLRAAFQNKIVPLLQEYFYGDYGKIGLVLGEGFVRKYSVNHDNIFAKFGDYDIDGLAEKEVYHLVNALDMEQMPEDNFKAALVSLMK